jgi:hypothetical protein
LSDDPSEKQRVMLIIGMNPFGGRHVKPSGAQNMSQTPSARQFRVHARHIDRHHARLVVEPSFEAAAIAYLEDFDLARDASDDREMKVIVHEIETGHEHCFRIDLDTGDYAPCG